MDPRTIASQEKPKQLYVGFKDAFKEFNEAIMKYLRKKDLDKPEHQEKVLRYYFLMQAYMKLLAAKIVSHSPVIVKEISEEVLKKPEESSKLLPKIGMLARSLSKLEFDASTSMGTSDALRRLARNTRGGIEAKWRDIANRVKEEKKQQQAVEQSQYSKEHELEKRRKLELLKRKGFFSSAKEKVRR
ncbi:MAG: hypothetical protein IH934_00470 [Nanoarchaeota archaeon]|nr:hypothetical protein [Nanoarchaeota archaeon]